MRAGDKETFINIMGLRLSKPECSSSPSDGVGTMAQVAYAQVRQPSLGRGRKLSVATLRNLETIQNTDGVIEAWLGEQDNVFYVTLRNLRVICLRGFHLTALVDHIKQLEQEESDANEQKMGEKSASELRQKLSPPHDFASSSLNIKSLAKRRRRRMLEKRAGSHDISSFESTTSPEDKPVTFSAKTTEVSTSEQLGSASDLKSQSCNGSTSEDLLSDSRNEELEKWTQIAASYFEAMGVVKDIDSIEIFRSFNLRSSKNAGSDMCAPQTKIRTRASPTHSFLSDSDNGSVHSEARQLAGSGLAETGYSSNTLTRSEIQPFNRPDVPLVGASARKNAFAREQTKALSLDSHQQNQLRAEAEANWTIRKRFIKVPRSGRSKDIYLSGADTLGGLPEDSYHPLTHMDTRSGLRSRLQRDSSFNPERRSFSMPETPIHLEEDSLMGPYRMPPLSLNLDEISNENTTQNAPDSTHSGGEPTSDLLGVTFIVGGKGDVRDKDPGKGNSEDVSNDFTMNSASYFSSSSSNQEKVNWISETPATRRSDGSDAKSKRAAFSRRRVENCSPASSTEVTGAGDISPSSNGGFSSDLSSLASAEEGKTYKKATKSQKKRSDGL
ncbi:uncharacterized protein LOC101849997 [Aplysia californica]|uniref:Uncharacterized protein LOC101849997 n=1 Tax=Aplysia californica TaxID=6500 RepID=A0ABM0JK32_APLCA|nr:uncharacterized protein LOC101849997 [Aplysia californica]